MPSAFTNRHISDNGGAVTRAPLLLRYGLWLTAAVYGFAALTLEDSPIGPAIIFQMLYYSVSLSGVILWFRPDIGIVRRWHVVVPTALITIGGADAIRNILVALEGGDTVLLAISGFLGVVYIGIVQYVFLPLSILHKSGPT